MRARGGPRRAEKERAVSENGSGSKSSSNAARAARILVALGEADADGLSLTGLSEALGDGRTSVHRAVTALAEFGLVAQAGRRGNYHLGPAIPAMAGRARRVSECVALFRPVLIEVAAETGLATYLMARAGFDTVCLDWQSGFATVPAMFDGVGGRLPLGVGVGGIVMLGQMDADSRDRILSHTAPRFAEWGLTEEGVRAELDAYLHHGWALVSRRSGHTEVSSLAVPAMARGLRGGDLAISVLAPGRSISPATQSDIRASLSRHMRELLSVPGRA